jgi:hypothetical protein
MSLLEKRWHERGGKGDTGMDLHRNILEGHHMREHGSTSKSEGGMMLGEKSALEGFRVMV